MLQHNRTGEGGSSHNGPAGVTGQSCGNFAHGELRGSSCCGEVAYSGVFHDVLCLGWGRLGGGLVCLGPTLLPAFQPPRSLARCTSIYMLPTQNSAIISLIVCAVRHVFDHHANKRLISQVS